MASMVTGLSHFNIPFGKFITTFLKSISTGQGRSECSAPERILRLLVPDAGSGLWLQLPFTMPMEPTLKRANYKANNTSPTTGRRFAGPIENFQKN